MSSPTRPHNKRAKVYQWVGPRYGDDRPVEHLGPYGIPDRDLTEEETSALTGEQVEIINAHPELYKPIDADAPVAITRPKRVRKQKAPKQPAEEQAPEPQVEPPAESESQDPAGDSETADDAETGE